MSKIIEIGRNPIKNKKGYKKLTINSSGERNRKEFDMPAFHFPNGKWIYFKQISESSKKLIETWHKMLKTELAIPFPYKL